VSHTQAGLLGYGVLMALLFSSRTLKDTLAEQNCASSPLSHGGEGVFLHH
jgi:hypothetical protein